VQEYMPVFAAASPIRRLCSISSQVACRWSAPVGCSWCAMRSHPEGGCRRTRHLFAEEICALRHLPGTKGRRSWDVRTIVFGQRTWLMLANSVCAPCFVNPGTTSPLSGWRTPGGS